MRKLPLIPTLLVAAAVAVMIGLGIWQLQRKAEKEALLARYAAAQGLPPIAWPAGWALNDKRPLFRRASASCDRIVDLRSEGEGEPSETRSGWRSEGGRNAQGESGWVHVATCSSKRDGIFHVVMGWSRRPETPDWKGGRVSGVIGSDPKYGIRLVAADPAPGLQAARLPSLKDVPNNHLLYAIQWFFFAGAAAVIYVLALRRRSR